MIRPGVTGLDLDVFFDFDRGFIAVLAIPPVLSQSARNGIEEERTGQEGRGQILWPR
jgi:hypothetical protein